MRTLFKWAFRLFVVMIILIVAGILLMDSAIKALAISRIKERTGMEVKIGRLEFGLWNPRIAVEDVVLYNTADFGGGPMLELKELRVEYDRAALRERKLHLKLLRLDLTEFTVVQNRDGKTNLQDAKERSDGAKDKEREAAKGKLEFAGIDTLSLNLGKLHAVDLRQPEAKRTIDLRVQNEVFTDLKNQESLNSKVFGPLILRAGLPALYDGLFRTPDFVKPKAPRNVELTASTTNALPAAVNQTVR